MDGERIVVAPPFLGEFGWEVMYYLPFVRKFSESHKGELIVFSPEKSAKDIYKFKGMVNTRVVFIPCPEVFSSDCFNGFDDTGAIIDVYEYIKQFISRNMPEIDDYDILNFSHYQALEVENGWVEDFDKKYLSFIPYGEMCDSKENIVCVHARNRQDVRPTDNWGESNWDSICHYITVKGYRICSIGSPSASLHIKGTEDCRGINFKDISNLLSKSKLCIGPSSGPMHLASLCKCSHFVWSKKLNRKRYFDSWNPFKTECFFYSDEGFQPSAYSVIKRLGTLI